MSHQMFAPWGQSLQQNYAHSPTGPRYTVRRGAKGTRYTVARDTSSPARQLTGSSRHIARRSLPTETKPATSFRVTR